MSKRVTQKDRVLMYVKEFGSITRRESYIDLGIVELPARICELEAMGYKFDRTPESSKNRFGETVCYTRYSLAER